MRPLISILLLATLPCWAISFPANLVLEVRPTGSDTNGGFFEPNTGICTGGTDYSQQAAAQITFDGATITAATAGSSPTIVITGYPVATTDKCNALRISGGTNFAAGIYYISSVNVGANTWTLDRNVATGVGATMTGKMGGALLTLAQAFTDIDGGGGSSSGRDSTIWWKSTTETIASTLTMPHAMGLIVHGYQTTRGDNTGTRPLLTSATNSVNLITAESAFTDEGMVFNNLSFSHTAGTRGACFKDIGATGGGIIVVNSVLDGCLYGLQSDSAGFTTFSFLQTEIKNSINDGILAAASEVIIVISSHIHNNGRDGIRATGNVFAAVTVDSSVLANNAEDGLRFVISSPHGPLAVLRNSVLYGNTGSGFYLATSQQGPGALLINNIFEGNTRYGIDDQDSTSTGPFARFNNGFYGNLLGAINQLPTDSTDITGSASFFVNAAGNNFAINSTSGAGALLRATGFPATIPNAGTGYLDIGALQSQGASGTCSSSCVQ